MREGKGFGCWCRNGSQERSLLSEFLPPPVLNTGEKHPAVVPEEKKGQDKLQGLPGQAPGSACCSSGLCKSPPASRALLSPGSCLQSHTRKSHFPPDALQFTAQEMTSDKLILCCVSGSAWAFPSTGQKRVTFAEGCM